MGLGLSSVGCKRRSLNNYSCTDHRSLVVNDIQMGSEVGAAGALQRWASLENSMLSRLFCGALRLQGANPKSPTSLYLKLWKDPEIKWLNHSFK